MLVDTATRRTEIRGRLQELTSQSLAPGENADQMIEELKAIGAEASALWAELDALDSTKDPIHAQQKLPPAGSHEPRDAP